MGRMTVMKEAAKWDMSSVRVQSRRFLSRHRRGCRAGAALRGRARQRLRGISIGHVVTEQGCSQVRHVGVRTTMGRVAAQAPRPTWTSIGRRGSLGARATSACGRQWAAWRRRRRVPRGPAWGGVSRGRARHVGVRTGSEPRGGGTIAPRPTWTSMGRRVSRARATSACGPAVSRVAAAQSRRVPRGPAWGGVSRGRARDVGVRTGSEPRGGGTVAPRPTWTSIGASLGGVARWASAPRRRADRQWAAWRRRKLAPSHVDQHWGVIGRRGSLGERATSACGRPWAAWRRRKLAPSHVDQHWGVIGRRGSLGERATSACGPTVGRVAAAQARPIPRGPALGDVARWASAPRRRADDNGPRGGGTVAPRPTWTSIGRRGSLGERATPACGPTVGRVATAQAPRHAGERANLRGTDSLAAAGSDLHERCRPLQVRRSSALTTRILPAMARQHLSRSRLTLMLLEGYCMARHDTSAPLTPEPPSGGGPLARQRAARSSRDERLL